MNNSEQYQEVLDVVRAMSEVARNNVHNTEHDADNKHLCHTIECATLARVERTIVNMIESKERELALVPLTESIAKMEKRL